MSSDVSREELVADVLAAIRRESSQASLFSQAVAERVGLAGNDIECLEALLTGGRMTVGQLAETTGLTTGSATRMVDRLEQTGFVKRVSDPTDRRRVLVEAAPGTGAKLSALHDSIRTAQIERLGRYDEDQLRFLIAFLNDAADVATRETRKMRAIAGASDRGNLDRGGSYAAPLGGITSGRLIFLTGAPRITVSGDPQLTELYKADFVGPVPRMRVRGGVVTVAYPRFGWFDWRAQIAGQFIDASAHWQKDFGDIVLNAAIPWAIEMRGGISTWNADLRSMRLESFELKGGASQIELLLPKPVGVVAIRIVGGLNRMSIERPAGTATGLEIHGGVGEVVLDGETRKGAGRLSIETPGAAGSTDRYEIEITGGAARLAISSR
jgi:DNA-binding MarR family transcriptional regulator